jgi:hypothetical protein
LPRRGSAHTGESDAEGGAVWRRYLCSSACQPTVASGTASIEAK